MCVCVCVCVCGYFRFYGYLRFYIEIYVSFIYINYIISFLLIQKIFEPLSFNYPV